TSRELKHWPPPARRGLGMCACGLKRAIYLALTEERYAVGGLEAAKVIGAPPLRSAEDQASLWEGLRTGEIQTIGSDNTSWTPDQRRLALMISRGFRME